MNKQTPHSSLGARAKPPKTSSADSERGEALLRQAAFNERRKIYDLLIEGVELALKDILRLPT